MAKRVARAVAAASVIAETKAARGGLRGGAAAKAKRLAGLGGDGAPVTPMPAERLGRRLVETAAGFGSSRGDCEVLVGDCREVLAGHASVARGEVDLVFADPPFNWNRAYDQWDDKMPREDYLKFTYDWLDLCIGALKPTGTLFVNIPDDTCAEIVCYLKGQLGRKPVQVLHMVNWCVWHYRFGQNRDSSFINSKVHVLYFCKNPARRTWNAGEVLELSDRASTYGDARTLSKKDGMPAGLRVPLDVWYGPYWGRIQGNNAERRHGHDNQLPEVYLERVIRCASNPGDLVMDPFTGSGTTGTVALELGRRYLGSEFSRENAKRASERMVLLGPARPLGQQRGVSTSIAPKRRALKVPELEWPGTR
jgi:site-specific DNA-methyltransferase (adenine-specific)